MNTEAVTRYAFETEFAADGTILRDGDSVRLSFTRDEMQIERDKAYEKGRQDALAQATEQAAVHIRGLEECAAKILSTLKTETQACRSQAMELVLLAARKIAGAALERFPQVRVQELVRDMIGELRNTPRLVVVCPAHMPQDTERQLQQIADKIDFAGQLLFQQDVGAGPGDVRLEWEQGAVCISTDDIAKRVDKALRHWLTATTGPDGQRDLFEPDNNVDEEN